MQLLLATRKRVRNKRALPPTGEIGEAKLYTPLWGGGTATGFPKTSEVEFRGSRDDGG